MAKKDTWTDSVETGVNPYTGEDMRDMPLQAPMSQDILDDITAKIEALSRLRDMLPMFYTPRGNIVKIKGTRLTGKTVPEMLERARAVETDKRRIIVVTDSYTLTLTGEASKLLRETGQVTMLILAGWYLRVE